MKQLVKAMTAEEAHEIVERSAKEKAVSSIRRIETMDIGKVVRQGDIYIHCVDYGHLRGTRTDNRQLAQGESLGSRHMAEEPAEIYVGEVAPPWYDLAVAPLLGPCIVSSKRFMISHPEHAHVDLPAGVYQITHQMDARTQTRARD